MNKNQNNNEYNDFRQIYLNNIVNREYPILPAYYFYTVNTSNKNVLSASEFQDLFLEGVMGSIHPISLAQTYPEMDINEVFRILDNYYNIQYLLDKEGTLIQII